MCFDISFTDIGNFRDALLAKYNLSSDQVNRQIEGKDLAVIASYFDGVDPYCESMTGVTVADKEYLRHRVSKENGFQVAMIRCLSIWKANDPMGATFSALLHILLHHNKRSIADQICLYLAGSE